MRQPICFPHGFWHGTWLVRLDGQTSGAELATSLPLHLKFMFFCVCVWGSFELLNIWADHFHLIFRQFDYDFLIYIFPILLL